MYGLMMGSEVILTSAAIEAVRSQLEKRGTPDAFLRLGLRGGGCSGFSYVIEFDDNGPGNRDFVFVFGDVIVLVDPKSMIYLSGSTLDWQKALMWSGFKFINPHEKKSCGCGQSFEA